VQGDLTKTEFLELCQRHVADPADVTEDEVLAASAPFREVVYDAAGQVEAVREPGASPLELPDSAPRLGAPGDGYVVDASTGRLEWARQTDLKGNTREYDGGRWHKVSTAAPRAGNVALLRPRTRRGGRPAGRPGRRRTSGSDDPGGEPSDSDPPGQAGADPAAEIHDAAERLFVGGLPPGFCRRLMAGPPELQEEFYGDLVRIARSNDP
jgi:hypothetical protein